MVKKYRWSYPEKTIEKAKNFYDEGHSYPWIANQLGMPRWMTVYDWKKKFNWDRCEQEYIHDASLDFIDEQITVKKEEKMSGLTQDVTKIWNKLTRGDETNSGWIRRILKESTGKVHARNRISGVLHRFVTAECAKKASENSYKKIKNYKSRRMIPELTKGELLLETSLEKKDQKTVSLKEQPTDSINILTLGKAWDALTDDLKVQVTELRKQLSEERKTVGELVEQKRELEELYKKAQTRILELNTGGKGKSISLSALQNFRDELPE